MIGSVALKAHFKKVVAILSGRRFTFILSFLVMALAGTIAYRNSFSNSFVFDDIAQILQNPNIQSLDWPWRFLWNNRRPVLYTTLAFDFHQYGFNPFFYHVFNLRVHILTAMFLFLLIQKTLSLSERNIRLRQNAELLALSAALLWLLHPIQTQAVTYIIQRAESLMGLFFVVTMYCVSQYFTSRKTTWLVSASITSLLCGLTKEVALVLPLMVLFYDRTFISQSIRAAFKDHRLLYAGLSVTWVVMLALYFLTSPEEKLTAGFGMTGMTPLLYAMNQPAVFLHYLRIALWPDQLIFDYEWPPVHDLHILWPSIILIVSWMCFLVAAYPRYRGVSFLLLSFFIILLPSSSFIPLKDLIFEYRLYLPLSCLAVMFVLAVFYLTEQYGHQRSRQALFVATMFITAMILGGLTYQRNGKYQNEAVLWYDVIIKQPANSRAFNNLGQYLLRQGQDEKAEKCFLQAIALNSTFPDAYANMVLVLAKKNQFEKAINYAQKAVELSPDFAIAYNNLGSALCQTGRYAESIVYYEKALALGLQREGVYISLGTALIRTGQYPDAIKVLDTALNRFPDSLPVRNLFNEAVNFSPVTIPPDTRD